jgi:hypothetical protein
VKRATASARSPCGASRPPAPSRPTAARSRTRAPSRGGNCATSVRRACCRVAASPLLDRRGSRRPCFARQLDGRFQRKVHVAVAVAVRERMQVGRRGGQSGSVNESNRATSHRPRRRRSSPSALTSTRRSIERSITSPPSTTRWPAGLCLASADRHLRPFRELAQACPKSWGLRPCGQRRRAPACWTCDAS